MSHDRLGEGSRGIKLGSHPTIVRGRRDAALGPGWREVDRAGLVVVYDERQTGIAAAPGAGSGDGGADGLARPPA